jgi:uncharacterized protein YqhQ
MQALLIIALFIDFGALFGGDAAGSLENTAGWVLLGILCVLILIRLFFIKDVLKYHAAEHMALNTFESGRELTLENISMAARTHPRCGTLLAIYVVLVAVPCAVFIPYVSATLVLTASVSYELFLNSGRFRILKGLAKAGLWLQKTLATAAPEKKHIELARQCLLMLLFENEK